MNDSWTQKKCKPCEGIEKPLSRVQAQDYLKRVPGWQAAADAKGIYRDYVMKNFTAAVDAITKVAGVAEAEGHHPDVHLTGYRKLRIELSTHAIGGLSENDFIVAARINELDI